MSNSNFEYEYRFHDIKISMNAYQSNRNYEYDLILFIYLNTHCWSLIFFFYSAALCHAFRNTYIHTYIIGHYNPSVWIIDLVSHTTYVVWVLILYISGGTKSLKSTPNDRFFEKLFMTIFIYSQSFCQKSAKRKSRNKYFSYFVLMFGLGPGIINIYSVYCFCFTRHCMSTNEYGIFFQYLNLNFSKKKQKKKKNIFVTRFVSRTVPAS